MTSGQRDSALCHFPPMGVYETLFKFLDATGKYMGTEGTHPWAQGFPLTTPLPGGPDIPTRIDFTHQDLKYPQATGGQELLVALRDYYRHFYGANLTTDNIAIFAGGRPAIYATLAFLKPEMRVLVEETEYTPYWDALRLLSKSPTLIPSNPENAFRPGIEDYEMAGPGLVLKSNPSNPTGVTWTGERLRSLVALCSQPGWAGLIDEAYEFFHEPEPDSALRYVEDIDRTNLFVVSAATKGLQAPGLRVGWIAASKANIELFRNFSSIAMGGVARPSQICVAGMLELERVAQARRAVGTYYGGQRKRYEAALADLGFELFTGDGGFYHWARLPGGLTADAFNERLFAHQAAILPGPLCDMLRRGPSSPLSPFIRFSFGPLKADSFETDVAILAACVR
ncbi:pyridoxal phosphate-dependent aminotransferase [Fimbriimonas ginsengisoli]|uniref:Aspartate aminotransferase n=1 Tax=Fimbriimonas ginsengisoli Gsoil 348 TaxID=661478 RepID=A0A068NJR3_FIMGI|nr:pyridoxal phosphate-dependent aminotransferase [Fimbriimonas ginsengisoli]AIE83692.1 aspartate aminotransferase [Fimbriimonas ginsengisoli Gsoil 348]